MPPRQQVCMRAALRCGAVLTCSSGPGTVSAETVPSGARCLNSVNRMAGMSTSGGRPRHACLHRSPGCPRRLSYSGTTRAVPGRSSTGGGPRARAQLRGSRRPSGSVGTWTACTVSSLTRGGSSPARETVQSRSGAWKQAAVLRLSGATEGACCVSSSTRTGTSRRARRAIGTTRRSGGTGSW